MKRFLSLLLIPIVCFSLFGCKEDQPKLLSPVNFYYLRLEPTYGAADSLIAAVPTESIKYTEDTAGLINFYLTGPSDENFESPFPADTKLLSLTVTNGVAHLQLNKSFAQLTGIDLTVACACLTLTALELTEATSVRITAKNATLDGAAQVFMDRSCLTMLDAYTPEST